MNKIFISNARARLLLKALVESYISSGQPVGSRILSRSPGLNVSPATIRNIMADLEKLGLISSPHTSAGRIPTEQGYRLFVDNLLSVQPINQQLISQMKSGFQASASNSGRGAMPVLEKTLITLSGLTHMAGLVVLPRKELLALSQIEFVPLSDNRILVVLVQSNDEVQNRVIQLEKPVSQDQLQKMSNYLNSHLAGKTIREICKVLLQDLTDAREKMDLMMQTALELAQMTFSKHYADSDDFMVAGETNLMRDAEMDDMEKLRNLFDAFHEKKHILDILNQVSDADGVKLFIGSESGYEPLNNYSVIAAPYRIDGQAMGVLSVIGPTRMAYDKVIPIVDITAKLLSSVLNHEN